MNQAGEKGQRWPGGVNLRCRSKDPPKFISELTLAPAEAEGKKAWESERGRTGYEQGLASALGRDCSGRYIAAGGVFDAMAMIWMLDDGCWR